MVRRSSAAENVEAADRPLGLRNRRLQQPHQAAHHGLRIRALEQIGLIVEPQLQPLAWYGGEAQGIVGHVEAADVGEPQAAGLGRQAAAVDRVVLEHRQRVEQLAQAGEALDLRQAQMLVRHQPRLARPAAPS